MNRYRGWKSQLLSLVLVLPGCFLVGSVPFLLMGFTNPLWAAWLGALTFPLLVLLRVAQIGVELSPDAVIVRDFIRTKRLRRADGLYLTARQRIPHGGVGAAGTVAVVWSFYVIDPVTDESVELEFARLRSDLEKGLKANRQLIAFLAQNQIEFQHPTESTPSQGLTS